MRSAHLADRVSTAHDSYFADAAPAAATADGDVAPAERVHRDEHRDVFGTRERGLGPFDRPRVRSSRTHDEERRIVRVAIEEGFVHHSGKNGGGDFSG